MSRCGATTRRRATDPSPRWSAWSRRATSPGCKPRRALPDQVAGRTAPRLKEPSRASAAWHSDHLSVLEPRDLVPRVAEQVDEDLLGVLSELGCRMTDGPGCLAQANGNAHDLRGAECGMVEGRHVLVRRHLRIVGKIIDGVDDADDEVAAFGEEPKPLRPRPGRERLVEQRDARARVSHAREHGGEALVGGGPADSQHLAEARPV